jgi:hypothetical protein
MKTVMGSHLEKISYELASRRFHDKRSAIDWRDFCESQEPDKKHKFFIIAIEEEIMPYYGQER